MAILFGVASVLVPFVSQHANATAPSHVNQTLEGCRNDGTITLPNGSGDFVCPDSAYTTGNLGKGWNELDLVPWRLTLTTTNSAPSTQTYTTGVAVDAEDGGHPGFDVLSTLTLNTDLSDASCPAGTVGPQTDITPGFGGIDKSLGRTITLTQLKSTTCVYDFYARLALGSHLFPGSSLHGDLTDESFSGETQNVPIPVNEIKPQELSKDMVASQGSDHIWDVVKSPSPAELHFGDTCTLGDGPFSQNVDITVTWTKEAAVAGGPATIITHVYATNPASRTITINATDKIYAGTTQTTLLDTASSGDIDVPANTTNALLLTHTFVWNSPNTSSVNDVATATYTDKVTGVPVPGTTQATASATIQPTGPETNQSATITDTESITGTGLTFSVAAPSVGSFTNYTADDHTTGPVEWSSGSQSDSGSVTFNKTVYLDQPRITSGTLSDTATLTGSDGFTTDNSASVDIDSTATSSITVSKTIDVVLGASDGSETFTFELYDGSTLVDSKDITFNVGDGGSAKTATFDNLTPGVTYTVHEVASSYGYNPPPPDQDITVNLPDCSAEADFANTHNNASAQVKKVTDPAGHEAGWTFDLHSGSASGTIIDTVTTTGTGFEPFTGAGASLGEGTYTITEQSQAHWDNTGSSGDCSFTVNMPADAGKVFSCTFNNRERGEIDLVKTFQGATPTGSQTFSFDLRTGASAGVAGTIVTPPGTVTLNSGNSWSYDWTDLVPGTYQLCENGIPAGGHSSLESDPNHFSPGLDNSTVCVPVVVGAGDVVSITVDNTPPPGGSARTIGYWKNWSSCDGKGHQAPVLDQTLYAAGPNGISVGILVLHGGLTPDSSPDCFKAINVLNKTTIDGKKKMASDPLFNMAAQLLAAELNVVAGAATCPAATTAITQAQALLVKYSWNGLTYSPKLTTADRNLANSLNGTLDSYNNNTLC